MHGAYPSDPIRGLPTGDGGGVASHGRYTTRFATEAHEELRQRKERASACVLRLMMIAVSRAT
jgi:hypothetical protein